MAKVKSKKQSQSESLFTVGSSVKNKPKSPQAPASFSFTSTPTKPKKKPKVELEEEFDEEELDEEVKKEPKQSAKSDDLDGSIAGYVLFAVGAFCFAIVGYAAYQWWLARQALAGNGSIPVAASGCVPIWTPSSAGNSSSD